MISYPGVAANGLLALLTGVGVQALITFHTVRILLSQNVPLPKQGLLAVVAVVAFWHFHPESLTWEAGKDKDTLKWLNQVISSFLRTHIFAVTLTLSREQFPRNHKFQAINILWDTFSIMILHVTCFFRVAFFGFQLSSLRSPSLCSWSQKWEVTGEDINNSYQSCLETVSSCPVACHCTLITHRVTSSYQHQSTVPLVIVQVCMWVSVCAGV